MVDVVEHIELFLFFFLFSFFKVPRTLIVQVEVGGRWLVDVVGAMHIKQAHAVACKRVWIMVTPHSNGAHVSLF